MVKIKKTLWLCAFSTICLSMAVAASLDCPYGTTPTLDGTLSPNEWADAVHLTDTYVGSHMYVKHDGENVYFAFDDVPPTGDIEHFFDTENDDANTPQPDDYHYGYCPWWTYEEHGNGQEFVPVSPSGWTAVCVDLGSVWRGEISFSFDELSIVTGQSDTLGMMLFAGFNWGGGDWTPSTWPDFFSSSDWSMSLEETASIEASVPLYTLDVSPNPFSSKINIRWYQTKVCETQPGSTNNYKTTIQIYDAAGCLVHTLPIDRSTNSSVNQITWSGKNYAGERLASGVYFLKFVKGNHNYSYTEKIIFAH